MWKISAYARHTFLNTKVFVPASFIADGGLIDSQYPVSGGNNFPESGKKCPEGAGST
jgi:hypothetical protein